LAKFLGIDDPPVRINELSSARQIVHRLEQVFGRHPDWTPARASMMQARMLKNLREDRKEEYSSALGLAKLYKEATGQCLPQCAEKHLADPKLMEEEDAFTKLMCTEAENIFKQQAQGKTYMDFDAWFAMFGIAYFGSADNEVARAAFNILDINGSGSLQLYELLLVVTWACREYPMHIKNFDNVIDVVMRHLILPNVLRGNNVAHNAGLSTENMCKNAAASWAKAFNEKDWKSLSEAYSEDAVLHVDLGEALSAFMTYFHIQGPYFVCRGRANIWKFWNAFRDKVAEFRGFDPESRCTAITEGRDAAILQSKFSCTTFDGWIHGRYMCRNDQGEWKIQADHMEFGELLSEPKGQPVNLSHLAASEDAILEGRQLTDNEVRESLFKDANEFKNAFNSQNPHGCAEAYSDVTVMRADIPAVADLMKKTFGYEDPVILRDKQQIETFWSRMINDVQLRDMKGYERVNEAWPMTICVLSDNMGLVRSKWRMDKVGGHIHSQRMVREDPQKPWKVAADFFAIYETFP